MMAGIGPFAVPAALRGCKVYANDLNPKSFEYLCTNVKENRVESNSAVYNQCGREFFKALLRPGAGPAAMRSIHAESTGLLSSPTSNTPLRFGPFSHVLMNLPASALEFLDVFVGAFDRRHWDAPLPRVHCYCFSKSEQPETDVISQVSYEDVQCPCNAIHTVRESNAKFHLTTLCCSG